jgi:hypothetical protein
VLPEPKSAGRQPCRHPSLQNTLLCPRAWEETCSASPTSQNPKLLVRGRSLRSRQTTALAQHFKCLILAYCHMIYRTVQTFPSTSAQKASRLKKAFLALYRGVSVSIAHRINQMGLHLPLACVPRSPAVSVRMHRCQSRQLSRARTRPRNFRWDGCQSRSFKRSP